MIMDRLQGRTYGEGVPLVRGHCRDIDENPVAGIEVELGRSLDDQPGDVGGKEQSCLDLGGTASKVDVHNPQCLVEEPDAEREDNPEPSLRCVEHQEREVEPVEQVAEVEDLKMASASDERERTDKNDRYNYHQHDSSWVCKALAQTK